MGLRYKVWPNKAEFDTWIAAEDAAHGYPGIHTLTYSDFYQNPKNSTGVSVIDDHCIDIPSDLISFEEAENLGFFGGETS